MVVKNWKRTYALIWGGQLASVLTSSVAGFAVVFWMSLECRSAEVLAWAALASILPQSLLGPLVGVYVDRWNRRRTMIAADGAIALCTLAIALLFRSGAAELWHLYLLLACRSMGAAFHTPAMQASMPLLVPAEELPRVAGANQTIISLSNVAGPALGALLLNFTSIDNILMLDVAGAAIACTTLLFVAIPNPAPQRQKPHLWRELREGLAAVRAVRGMGTLFALAIGVIFFLRPVGVQFPLLTLEHFGGGSYEMSLIETVWGGGALIGSAIMGARLYRINHVMLICAMDIIVGVSIFISGILPPEAFMVFALLTAAEGIAGGVFNSTFIAVVQSRLESGVLGRVLACYYSIGMLPTAVGLLGTGFVAERFGLTAAFVASGAIIILISVAATLSPALRALGKKGGEE